MDDVISKSDLKKAYNYLENILKQDVESIELSDRIPSINDLSDANTVFKGKLSVLFVDIRKSINLADELEAINMAKVYRAFIRSVVQAIRYSGGESRQFAGDGVMAVFQDNAETSITSEQQAIKAARYIISMVDYCLNPLLSKHMDGLAIGCGIGIRTGTVLMTKVGMRGKEADENSENEMSIVWTGSTTNYASRYCSLAKACEIFVDETTYANAQNNGKWEKDTRIKDDKTFIGYIIESYYLSLPDDIDNEKVTCCEDKSEPNFTQEIFYDMKSKAVEIVNEITEKSMELSKKIDELNKKEQDLVAEKSRLLKEYEEKTRKTELSLLRRRYADVLQISKEHIVRLI